MPSPIFHSAAGLSLGRAGGRQDFDLRAALLFVLAANASDLDLLPGLLAGNPQLYHHGPTHSLAFGLLLGALLALIPWARAKTYLARWAWLAAAGCSHPLLDLLSYAPARDAAREPYIPLPLGWPVFSARFSTVARIFEGTHISTKVNECLSTGNVLAFAREAGAGVALVGLVWLATRFPAQAEVRVPEPVEGFEAE